MDLPKANTLLVVGGLLLVAGVAYQAMRVKKAIGEAHASGREALKPVTDAVWNMYSIIKGKPVSVESTFAGFVLNGKYVAPDGTIQDNWRQNITLMHPGNAELFSLITNERGQLLQKYQYLIGGEVSADTV